MDWIVGFGTFLAISVAARYGLEWMLDAFWSSEGLDPNSRPPSDPDPRVVAVSLADGVLLGG